MTQGDKELLLKDLCARFPYGVKLHVHWEFGDAVPVDSVVPLSYYNLAEMLKAAMQDGIIYEQYIVKPYLRPMSSMTEEEKQMMDNLWKDNNELVFADPDEVRRYRFYDISVVDFLNSRHFDYRGLIKKGLALEAPKDMYN